MPERASRLCSRRAWLRGAGAAALAACTQPHAASAKLLDDLQSAENRLAAATSTDDANAALQELLELAESFGGLPTQEATETLVKAMRAKRTALQAAGGEVWNGITEESYNRLMRSVDPWRVTELRPIAQNAVYGFPFLYIALLAVQQLLPATTFTLAYAVAATLLLGPLLAQIIIG